MSAPLVFALYLRDAAGLGGAGGGGAGVPPLEPAVEWDARLAPFATAGAAAQWSAWWESLQDPADAARARFPSPDGTLSAFGADLQALAAIAAQDAHAWLALRKREYTAGVVGGTDCGRSTVGRVIREVERELGRAAAPFELVISVLPVRGRWGLRARRDHLLASGALRRDAAAFRAFLRPAIDELAR